MHPGALGHWQLYRPKGKPGRLAAVLSPHGHWPGGRFQEARRRTPARQIASGAEPFDTAARYPLQARAVHLARLGVVTFFYDMEGYADSVQIPRAVTHELKGPRPQMHESKAGASTARRPSCTSRV